MRFLNVVFAIGVLSSLFSNSINVLSPPYGVSLNLTTEVQSPQVVFDKYGNAVAAYYNSSTHKVYLAYLPSGETTWVQQQVVSDFSGEVENINLAINANGRGVLVWEQKNEQIYSAIFQTIGKTLQVEGNINVSGNRGNIQSTPVVVISSAGTALCVWQDEHEHPWKLAAAMLPSTSNTWTPIEEYVSNLDTASNFDAVETRLNLNQKSQGILTWRLTIHNGNGQPIYSRRFTISNNTVSFGPILQITPTGVIGQEHPAQGIDGSGNVFIDWVNDLTPRTLNAAYLPAGSSTFTQLETISLTGTEDVDKPIVSINPSGYGVLTYQASNNNSSVYTSFFHLTNSTFSFLSQNTEVSSGANDPNVYIDADRNAVITYKDAVSSPNSFYLGFAPSGSTAFSGFTRISDLIDGGQSSAQIGFNADGRGAVIWQKEKNTQQTSGIQNALIFIYNRE